MCCPSGAKGCVCAGSQCLSFDCAHGRRSGLGTGASPALGEGEGSDGGFAGARPGTGGGDGRGAGTSGRPILLG